MPPPPRRRRLSGLARFLLAVTLAACVWWGINWLGSPRPLWVMHYPVSQELVFPVAFDEANHRIAACRVSAQDVQSMSMQSLLILDSRTGKPIHEHRLAVAENFGDNSMLIQHFAPLFWGDALWRMRARMQGDEQLVELLAWPFLTGGDEKVVHTWRGTAIQRFQVIASTSVPPKLLTQSALPWELLMPSLSFDGWTSTLASMAFMSSEDNTPMGQARRVWIPTQHTKQGLILPRMETWELPGDCTGMLKRVAQWNLPPQCTAWPPAMASDLSWVAFGDEHREGEWRVPAGVKIYDGRTGTPLPTPPGNQRIQVANASDRLLMLLPAPERSNAGSSIDIKVDTPTRLWDVSLGKEIRWSNEKLQQVQQLFPHPTKPLHFLGFDADTRFIGPTPLASNDSSSLVHHLELTDQGMKLHKSVTLARSRQHQTFFVHHVAVNEIGINAMIDPVPPFIRELAQQWPWLEGWVKKTWDDLSTVMLLFDLETGQFLREVHANYMGSMIRGNHPLAFTVDMEGDRTNPAQLPRFKALHAWRVPLNTGCWSPWWGRGLGLLVFLAVLVGRLRWRRGKPA